MAESIEPYHVVLEIAEEIGTRNVSNSVVIGQQQVEVYTGCAEPVNDQGDRGFNPTINDPGIRVVGYSGNYIGYYFGVGDMSLGCSQFQIQPQPTGVEYKPQTNHKLIVVELQSSIGVNPGFYRQEPWSFGNGLYRPYNGVQFGTQGAWNVQGKCFYVKRTIGDVATMCFDVVDAYGNDRLILKGNGGDHIDDYSSIDNLWHIENALYEHQNMEWYISPYVHSGKWNSGGGQISWDSEAESRIMSFRGESTGYTEMNECFRNTGYLGLRSADFREAVDTSAYNDNQPSINTGHMTWELIITVASINNAQIEIFEGTPENPAVTSGLSNGFNIQTAGSYTICLAALPHSDTWLGKNSPGGFQLSEAGMESLSQPGSLADMMDGQITLLNATAIDPSQSASIIIETIELRKKEPDIKREWEDIYGSTTDYDVPEYKWNFLEVFESEGVPLALNFSVGDISDISKRTSGYSKTFMLPASPHNHSVISPMIAVNSEKKVIGWQRGRIKADGINIFEGLMRIEEGNTGNGGFYKCHILEDTIDWAQDIGESKLCDVFMLGDDGDSGWESTTRNKSSADVKESWLSAKPFDTKSPASSFIPAQPWFWGLANYGEWYFKSIGLNTKKWTHNAQDFHPVVYTKVLVDRIFESIGYSVDSNFLNSTTAHLLCHPYGAGEDYLISNNIFGASGDYYAKAQTSGSHQADDLLGTSNFKNGGYIPAGGHDRTWRPALLVQSDISNTLTGNGGTGTAYGSSTHGYIVPFDGDYKMVLSGVIDVSYCYYGDGGTVRVEFLRNNIYMGEVPWGQLPGLVDHGEFAFADDQVMNGCQAGDVISFRIRAESYMWACKYWVRGKNLEALVYPLNTGGIPSIGMNNSKILTCDTKQIDLLKGLTDMFNLQWYADAATKTISVEPYNDFFGSGNTLDWTSKLDTTRWNDKFIVEELAKEIIFRYKRESSDKGIESTDAWRLVNNKGEYQTHIEIQNEKFRKESIELVTDKFVVQLRFNNYGVQPNPSQHQNLEWGWGDHTWNNPLTKKANPLMPAIWTEDGGGINNQNRPPRKAFPKNSIRIVNHYSLLNGHTNENPYDATRKSVHKCSAYQWEDDSGNATTLDEYPYMDWVDGWKQGIAEDPYCLSWDDYDDKNGKESLGLFEKYWRVAYEKMNGGAVLRTAFMNLNPIDIATFDFRDLIHLKIDDVSTYWTVNKIIDYQPNKRELTKVELLEFKNAKDFNTRGGGENGGVAKKKEVMQEEPITKEGGISMSRDNGFTLQNNSDNTSIGTGLALGTGVVANNNQTVLGKFNNPNTTDIFQVGIGTSDDDRQTAFSISKDGCVKIGGGEIYVEEADGTIHDLIIKKAPYKIAEREIDEEGRNIVKAVEFSDTDIEKLYSSEELEEEKNNRIQRGYKY